ncbi:NAD(P)(+) transhydrogenase (Re/Si-specific) subunit beta [Shewanella schlegeliana]|uniref:NAD(P) transhydrogenase subunit beta n=1 Tax=Shewanella schlegeliana TaxID=190308 RepID=A0ABS1SVY8_9GAMM|nr:NAD(P)(+) transhydrogenase (Re/Si-specific) subunit beta [Shewanella schlegeliana]MBL4912693.1 NAD(P)(+) transhydrogenase (Re/Si-specific) subunit beta [Shewanella schlegeliana]MCL1109797.1 NAD(P)(+) transhydrogenase (Re/Si-specific) subunit beta [Shewanella schlegeliana]GIU30254.1 NAD(P) transhydrogenase subunit beta [Shewanella schlegeliana]
MSTTIIYLAYLVAASLFILGIKGLTRPRTAVRGNQLSALGMFIAVVVTLLDQSILSYEWIIAGVLLGGTIGAVMATKIQVTSMPQMVAMLNGFGGGASLFIALANFIDPQSATHTVALVSITATVIIGAVTLSGSFIAFAKLQELISGNPIKVPGNKLLNALLLITAIGLAVAIVMDPSNINLIYALVAVSLVLGLLLVVPIGGADMPVVIALLNSYSGIAAATTGFITGNTVLIVSGSLVGASGIILTQIMCKAMNRSLFNVLFGVMAEGGETVDADEVYAGKVTSSSPEEVAMLLETAERVVIVPGYGLAMAQAQHAVRELASVMEARGTQVLYAIHPVAGRMPGHMNVLLAEAEVPYEQLIEMDEINPQFEQTDVAIVIGANDVTNPMAREDKGSPIYGMPILNVDKAKTVVVVKRSLSPGFAGLPNPLFAMDNSLMLFGDGKKAIVELTQSLKEAD